MFFKETNIGYLKVPNPKKLNPAADFVNTWDIPCFMPSSQGLKREGEIVAVKGEVAYNQLRQAGWIPVEPKQ